MLNIEITYLSHGKGLNLPVYATEGSAGLDLAAAVYDAVIIKPTERLVVPVGISIALPLGYEGQIRSRSGLAYKNGVIVLNSPGTIDSDYRGEIKVILINLGQESFILNRGMRIAQLVIAKYESINWKLVKELPDTQRSNRGLGSSGV